MAIEKIKLTGSNTTYPVGTAYVSPIVSGKPTTYEFQYDSTATTGSLSLTITPPEGYGDPIVTSATLFPLTENTFTSAEIATMNLHIVNNSSGVVGETNYPFVTNINGLIGWFLAEEGKTLDSEFSEFTQICGLAGIFSGGGVGIISTDSAVTSATAQRTISSVTTVDVELNIPAAGSYWLSTVQNPSIIQNLSGTLTVGTFDFDRRYIGTKIINILNGMIYNEFDAGNSINLNDYPSLNIALIEAAQMWYPVTIFVDKQISGATAITALTSIAQQSGIWQFIDGSTLSISGTSSNRTLTYTPANNS